MKLLKSKSEITAKELKSNNVDYKGKKLGYDGEFYFIGNHFSGVVYSFHESISDLKSVL